MKCTSTESSAFACGGGPSAALPLHPLFRPLKPFNDKTWKVNDIRLIE